MRNLSILISCFFVLSLSIGCAGTDIPKDLPSRSPCTVKVVYDDETPIPDATVAFVSEDSGKRRWDPTAITDASGVATMRIQATYDGAPVGKYKVCVSKTITEDNRPPAPPEGTPEHSDWAADYSKVKKYSVVDDAFGNSNTTTLEVEVLSQPENNHTVKVGSPVRKSL